MRRSDRESRHWKALVSTGGSMKERLSRREALSAATAIATGSVAHFFCDFCISLLDCWPCTFEPIGRHLCHRRNLWAGYLSESRDRWNPASTPKKLQLLWSTA
jgi:hypothetical protein